MVFDRRCSIDSSSSWWDDAPRETTLCAFSRGCFETLASERSIEYFGERFGEKARVMDIFVSSRGGRLRDMSPSRISERLP